MSERTGALPRRAHPASRASPRDYDRAIATTPDPNRRLRELPSVEVLAARLAGVPPRWPRNGSRRSSPTRSRPTTCTARFDRTVTTMNVVSSRRKFNVTAHRSPTLKVRIRAAGVSTAIVFFAAACGQGAAPQEQPPPRDEATPRGNATGTPGKPQRERGDPGATVGPGRTVRRFLDQYKRGDVAACARLSGDAKREVPCPPRPRRKPPSLDVEQELGEVRRRATVLAVTPGRREVRLELELVGRNWQITDLELGRRLEPGMTPTFK